MQNNETFDHIISLGEACFVATMLIDTKQRNFSSPFDWIIGADLQTRLNLILNDFKDFLNIEDLILMPEISPSEHHFMYLNTRNGIIFNHEFPKSQPLEESFPEVKEKYDRRIERFLDVLQNSKDILLLYMDMIDSKNQKLTIDQLTHYMVRINTKFPSNHIRLLYFKYSRTPNEKLIKVNKYLLTSEYSGVLPTDMADRMKKENNLIRIKK